MTGSYLCVAGPDGVGKSTLRAALESDELAGRIDFRHWRPGLLPALGSVRPSGQKQEVVGPHDRRPFGATVSALRLVYYWLDFIIGYLRLIRPAVQNGRIFILERGWWDMAVDPRRYRLCPLPRLHRALSTLTPRPDLYLILEADATTVRGRKVELSREELDRQRLAWRNLDERVHRRYLDARRPPEEIAEIALVAVRQTMVMA